MIDVDPFVMFTALIGYLEIILRYAFLATGTICFIKYIKS